MADQPRALGPVQLVIIAFEDGSFEGGILDELRRLRDHDAVRLIDLLFVAKGEDDEVTELAMGDLSAAEAERYGALVRALMGFEVGGDAASRNGSLLDLDEAWFLADQIPAGTAAAVALLEHRWAAPLRDAIEAASGHDLVDTWVHPKDLIAIGAGED